MTPPVVTRHADRIQGAVATGEAAKSALVASWGRSLSLHRLDPAERKLPYRITESELRAARSALSPLLDAAQASLDRLYLAVGGIGCCVLLADSTGVPLERRGAPADDVTFEHWGLWPGAVWSEDSEGTNGIGTCLVEQRTLTIDREQHFFTRNTAMSCTTAPLFDHEGKLAGALDVSSCRADLTDGFAALISFAVSDAACKIETENFRRFYSKERVVIVPGEERAALLAINSDDLVVGATRAARRSFDLTAERLAKGVAASSLIDCEEGASADFENAARRVVMNALARSSYNVSRAARELGVSRATLHRKLQRLGITKFR